MTLPETTETKGIEAWPLDVRIVAKWMMFFGVMLYVQWCVQIYMSFDGIFKADSGYVIGGDFINYWSAARLTLDHHIMTLFDIDGYGKAQQELFHHQILQFFNWSYPPFFIPFILWLGLFPYTVALGLWYIVTFALYAFAVCYKRPASWHLALMLILAPATYANFDIGQNGFLSAALLVGGLRLLTVRPTLAGILFGLLGFKPQLGLLIPIALIAARKWRVFVVAAITIGVLIGFSILLFGIEPWEAYIKVTMPLQRKILEIRLDKYITRMVPTPFMAMRVFGAGLPAAYAANALTAIGAVLAVIYAFRRCAVPDLRNAVLLTAMFLASPYIFFYDMTSLSAAVISTVAASGPRPKPYAMILLLVAWFLPAFVYMAGQANFPVAPLVTATLLGLQLHMIKSQQADAGRMPSPL